MTTLDKNSDRRQHSRRSLNMPISFLAKETKGDITDYCFGQTLDVSSCGVCVWARPDNIPDVAKIISKALFIETETDGRISSQKLHFDKVVPLS